jgi:transposase InsO family protein
MSVAAQSCGPSFSPRGSWSQVPPKDVQAQLRRAFRRWGRPERFRVDNGVPWGSWGDLPTDLALWLIGLGMGVDWNPPRRPQDNGVVERSQGTAKRWAEPQACATAGELQRRLEEMDGIQRQEYPSVRGRSRLEAFPQLAHSGRAYTPAWERGHWSLAAVVVHLAGYAVQRRVDKSGMVSLYNRNHYVGVIHRGTTVYVMFDPELREWVFADEKGQQLRRQPATEISRETIIGLKVTHRRKGTKDQ